MKTRNNIAAARPGRADRLLGRAPEPNLWNLGWPAVEERNPVAQWLLHGLGVASPRKCDASVSDS